MAEDPKITSNPTGTPEPEPHNPEHEGHVAPELPRLRTFADDLSEEIKKKGVTTATIVQAERERAVREITLDQDEAPKVASWKNPLLLGAALLFVALGILGVGGAYLYSTLVTTEEHSTSESIIFPNAIIERDQPPYQELSDLLALERFEINVPLGEITRIDPTLAHASTTAREILRALNAPETLLREVRTVMLGVHSFNRNQPFIIVEITQYDRAYGAMLRWEEDLGRALGNFFKPEGGKVPPTLTFTDKVFQNIDTRVSDSSWPVLYAFPRRDVLVITTNQYTLSEILTRLSAQTTGAVR